MASTSPATRGRRQRSFINIFLCACDHLPWHGHLPIERPTDLMHRLTQDRWQRAGLAAEVLLHDDDGGKFRWQIVRDNRLRI